jgi:hypothetical protein
MRPTAGLSVRILSLVLSGALVLGASPLTAQGEGETPPASPEKAPEPQTGKAPAETAAPSPSSPAPARAGATLSGRLLRPDKRTPLAAAVFHIIGEDGSVRSSAPSDERGRYVLSGVPPGTYILAVVSQDGVFSLESPIGITSAHPFTLDLATVPAEAATRRVPGVEAPARGFAYILQGNRPGGTTFWKGPKGITLIVASAVALGLAVAGGDHRHEHRPVSPSAP